MHGSAGPALGASARLAASRQFAALVIGTWSLGSVKPIIGPPRISFDTRAVYPPACAIRSPAGVPSRTSRLHGWAMPSPVSVTTREISGRPSSTASATAAAVATFWQTMPICAGMPWLGTSRPVSTRISCFSPPLGYLVGICTTSIADSPDRATASRIAAIASGLLSSIPTSTARAPTTWRRMQAPATTRGARSRISRSSQVM